MMTDREKALVRRKQWVAPVVQKIRAGEAELGTRPTQSDGAYTHS